MRNAESENTWKTRFRFRGGKAMLKTRGVQNGQAE
jgi:hypothetical protein